MTHLTEGSFEDTIIIVRFYCGFSSSNKKDEYLSLTLIVLLQLLVQGLMCQNISSNQLL